MTTHGENAHKLLHELAESEIEPEMTSALKASPTTHTQPQACGVFHGPGDLSRNVDKCLASTGFGER
jgi:hypothetical protein